MRRNFILVTFLFLFINILGFANKKSKDIDVISILDKEREASYFILNFSSVKFILVSLKLLDTSAI